MVLNLLQTKDKQGKINLKIQHQIDEIWHQLARLYKALGKEGKNENKKRKMNNRRKKKKIHFFYLQWKFSNREGEKEEEKGEKKNKKEKENEEIKKPIKTRKNRIF